MVSGEKQFYNLSQINGTVKLSGYDVVKEVRSLLSTRKGDLITNLEYGVTNLETTLSMTNDLNYLIPLLSVSLKDDIEQNTSAKVKSISIEKDKETRRTLNIYITYFSERNGSLRTSLLSVN